MIEVHKECTDNEDKSYAIHYDEEDKQFHIDSCDSHGGCVAASDIKYCPYCGKLLSLPTK
jgi:hypothetical protein